MHPYLLKNNQLASKKGVTAEDAYVRTADNIVQNSKYHNYKP